MRKLTGKVILPLIVVLMFLTGCNNERWELEEDFLLISSENFNITFYENLSMAREISFNIISSKELNDIDIMVDINTPYEFDVNKKSIVDIDDMPLYVYQSYKDIDWEQYFNLAYKANRHELEDDYEIDKEAIAEYSEFNEKYRETFEEFKSEQPYRNIYLYEVTLSFDLQQEKEYFNTMTIIADDTEHKFEIGKIKFDSISQPYPREFILDPLILGAWGKSVTPNSKGVLLLMIWSFYVIRT